MDENRLTPLEKLLAAALIACGPIGGLLIGIGESGSTTRTVGFILLGIFLLGGLGVNVWAVRRSRRLR
jgi:hypothetical protein